MTFLKNISFFVNDYFKGISAQNDNDQSLLKYCEWKGLEIPCSEIFTSFPTDQGMCCSFNMGAAEDIFIQNTYTRVIQNLQDIDKTMAFNSRNDQYTGPVLTKSQLKTEPGRSKGLTVILDAHSDFYSSTSFSMDTQGITGQISKSSSFPQRSLGRFDINPGRNNLVAIDATIIHSDDALIEMDPNNIRKCYFEWENSFMKLFKNYSQTNCLLECKLFNATSMMKQKYNLSYNDCLPWNFPSPNVNPVICDPWQTAELNELMLQT
jgi:amiloride-sensitive sodium channel